MKSFWCFSATPPKFNSKFTPEKWWLEDGPASFWDFSYFQGWCVKLPGSNETTPTPKTSPEEWPVHPGYLLYVWDEILPSHIGVTISHYEDPCKPVSTMECHVWVLNVAYLEIALGSFTRISFVRNWAAWEGFNAVIDMPFVLLGLASLGNKNMECDPKRGGENVIMLLTKRHIYVHIIYLHIYIYIGSTLQPRMPVSNEGSSRKTWRRAFPRSRVSI